LEALWKRFGSASEALRERFREALPQVEALPECSSPVEQKALSRLVFSEIIF